VNSGERSWPSLIGAKTLLLAATVAATLAACAPNTALLVRFPLGNVQRGREAFVALECNACHRVDGIELAQRPGAPPIDVALGGHTPRIETYGDILTAIVNPSHRLARSYSATAGRDRLSPMAGEFLNEVMTTQQLVDVAAFLRTEYDYVPPPPPPYWETYPGGDVDPFDTSR
jgi:sulfur-oxidizing protein SoxX